MFKENKYTKFYYQLVEKRKNNPPNDYSERHHIIPKSLGGSNENNLVRLTPREHFVCHLLLTKMVDGKAKQKMHWALHRMAFSRNNKMQRKYSSKEYALARNIHSNFLKENHPSKTDEMWSEKVSVSVKKSWKNSDNRRDNFSKTMKDNMQKWKNENPKAYISKQRDAALASKKANCEKIEYGGNIYVGWSELERETGLNKMHYRYYECGIDPFFRKGKNGPISTQDIKYILSKVSPEIALEKQLLTEKQLLKGGDL